MQRRRYLAGVGLAVASPIPGCLGDGPSGTEPSTDGTQTHGTTTDGTSTDGAGGTDDAPIVERFDCADADRPAPDVEAGVEREVTVGNETSIHESVGSVEYPEPPEEVDGETARTYVSDHERAYQRNGHAERYGEDLVELDVMVEAVETLEGRGEVAIVRIDFAVHLAVVDDAGLVTTEPAGEAAVYGLDETGVVRAEAEYRELVEGSVAEETPDPLEEGSILACF